MTDANSRIESEEFRAPFVRVRGRVNRRNEVGWSPCIRTFKGPDGLQHGRPSAESKDVGVRKQEHGDEPRRRGEVPHETEIYLPPKDDYWIAFETHEQKTLERSPVQVRWFSRDQQIATFSHRLPYHRTTRRVVLGRGEDEIGVLDVPAALPSFALAHPVHAHQIDTDGILHLRWEPGSDAKKHPHTYFVRFTSNGERFYRVGFNLTGKRFDLDLRQMPGGDECIAQVLATNGYQTAVVSTPAFKLPRKPTRLLLGPLDGQILFAQGFSLEDGPILGERIHWAVDGGTAGYGGTFDARVGGERHIVTVTVLGPDREHVTQDLGWYDGRTGRALEPERLL